MIDPDCPVCRSNQGVARISPGPPVHDGAFWVVEHAYPTSLLGWLVVVLKRHAVALHALTLEEAEELGTLQWAVTRALTATTGCRKEYLVFFAEGPGFAHVHLHAVPRASDLEPRLRAGRVFEHLRPAATDVIDPTEIAAFCTVVGAAIRSELGSGDGARDGGHGSSAGGRPKG